MDDAMFHGHALLGIEINILTTPKSAILRKSHLTKQATVLVCTAVEEGTVGRLPQVSHHKDILVLCET